MLKKASEESIVVGLTNLYDHFLSSTGECKSKVTAARLPYFDGDYWPGAAEDMICQIQQEVEDRKLSKKGSTKKTTIKRALNEPGQHDLSSNESMDQLLMRKVSVQYAQYSFFSLFRLGQQSLQFIQNIALKLLNDLLGSLERQYPP